MSSARTKKNIFLENSVGDSISLYQVDICPNPEKSNELFAIGLTGTQNNIDGSNASQNTVKLLANKVKIYRKIVYRVFNNHSPNPLKQFIFCRHSLEALLSEALYVSFFMPHLTVNFMINIYFLCFYLLL